VAHLFKNSMKVSQKPMMPGGRRELFSGFTLVELLVVVLIISVLLTVGAVGINRLTSGKGVANGVSNVEALFEEARSIAVGKGTKARVLVDKNSSGENYLRRFLVVSQELDPQTGQPKDPESWELSSRGVTLPEGTYFSQKFSKKDQSGGGQLEEMTLGQSATVKKDFVGDYFYYEFNREGLCTTPGATFILGAGARPQGQEPRVAGGAKRDFGGFVIWRNGRLSAFRSPDHIGIPSGATTF
jgi:prepilin-type N-terminal cleavage/methylation domain-containing protein